jgi:hypothetical protein
MGRNPQFEKPLFRMTTCRNLECVGHVGRKEEPRIAFEMLADKPIGKRLIGSPGHRWEDNISMDLKEICVNMTTN